MPRNWNRIVLKGSAQVIPAVCPNCLAPAGDLKLRSGYKGLEGWITRTTYFQTFSYCPECHPQAMSDEGLRSWRWIGGVAGVVAAILVAISVPEWLGDPVTHVCTPPMAKVGIALAFAVGLAAAVLTYGAARMVKRRRRPLRPSQAVWGRAAFYAGAAKWGTAAGSAVYLAARPEWIAALARANPEQLDENAYQQATGSARPPEDRQRPFGGG